MRDITLEETIYLNFTTRSFSTGVPTSLLGSPVLSVLESNNVTPITAGVSVQVDRASVTGLNQATIVATAANGYEAGKSYAVYISTGTVGGVSVVGEVVGYFTVQSEAAFTRLGAPAGASIAADLVVIDNFVDDLETRLSATRAGYLDNLSAGAVALESTLTTILNRLGAWTGTGINTILGAFRALVAKAASLTPTDLSTGTTFDNTTDSTEAIRDRGDAAWTTATGFATPTNITGGTITNVSQIAGIAVVADAVTRLNKSYVSVVTGVVGAASTTTSIVTSSLDPAAAATDQFKGKIVTFAAATTTAALRGQSTDITASTSGGVLTVTALTTAPVSGDIFVIT